MQDFDDVPDSLTEQARVKGKRMRNDDELPLGLQILDPRRGIGMPLFWPAPLQLQPVRTTTIITWRKV